MENANCYEHRVQYYETDQMKIVHHSNYIRWFEEARVAMLDKMGLGYKKMEELGVISPVLEVNAKYISMSHFFDVVVIKIEITEYDGIRLAIKYTVTDKQSGEVRCVGSSRHCFLNERGRPISLKKHYLQAHNSFLECMAAQNE